jgi:hypothetical protein
MKGHDRGGIFLNKEFTTKNILDISVIIVKGDSYKRVDNQKNPASTPITHWSSLSLFATYGFPQVAQRVIMNYPPNFEYHLYEMDVLDSMVD